VGHDLDLASSPCHANGVAGAYAAGAALFMAGSSGHRIYVDPDDARGRELVRSGGAMSAGTARLWDAVLALEEWDVLVDIGANYGEMLLGAQVPDGVRRICFEPNPKVLPFLRRSIEESGLDVDLREVAIGATETEAVFLVDTEWSGRSGLAGSHRTDEVHRLDELVVPVRALDAELPLAHGDSVCIKVDVEGGEMEVLRGAGGLLDGDRRWAVMIEILHMDAFEVAQLARTYTMRAMDRRTGDLILVPPGSPRRVAELIGAGWLHPQDAVLTAKVGP
jgi:FkbM family methyltransferase